LKEALLGASWGASLSFSIDRGPSFGVSFLLDRQRGPSFDLLLRQLPDDRFVVAIDPHKVTNRVG
jgi:hypothetical protein